MLSTTALALALGACIGVAAPAVETPQRLVLPVPDTSGIPKEKITLSIKIPPKIQVEDEIPAVRTRPRSTAWDGYDFHPFKSIPREKFIFETFKVFIRKGILLDTPSRHVIELGVSNETLILTCLQRLMVKLGDIHKHNALKRFNVAVEDLENLQQVIELLKQRLPTHGMSQVAMNKELDDMIAFLRKTSGKGQLRIIEVKEQKDGSTVLELEIVKGE